MRRLTLRKVAILVGLILLSFGLGKFFDSRCEDGCLSSEGKFAVQNLKHNGWNFRFGNMKIDSNDLDIDIDDGCEGDECAVHAAGDDSDVARPILPDLKGVEDVSIKTVSTEVHVMPGDGELPKLTIDGVRKGSNWKFNRTDKKLEIEVKGKNAPETLTLELPKSYKGNLSVETVSGVQDIQRNLTLKALKVQSVSGDMLVSTTPAEDVTANSVSGEIQAEIDAGVKTLSFNNVSGDIKVFLKSPFQTLKTQTVSGEVQVNLPKNVAFSYDLHSMSGDFQGLPDGGQSHEGIADHTLKGNFGQGAAGTIKFESVSGDFNMTRDAG